MANDNTVIDYSTISPNSYAAFDAISLRNLIIERLNEKGVFTDQNYIGSNLASIIDIVSYAFNTLMYYLNRTSTESMFTEAQLYENINRIVKLLDYKPVGYQTSTLPFNLYLAPNVLENNTYLIPRYSYIMVGGIPFSFNEDVVFTIVNESLTTTFLDQEVLALRDISNNQLLYQGLFRESSEYVATGTDSEIVSLNEPGVFADHFNVHVYVYEQESSKWYRYREVNNLYTEGSYDRVYEKRLNQNKIYEFQFGNNIAGKKLNAGDKVIVYYLQSFGEQGIIGPSTLDAAEVRLPSGITKTIFGLQSFEPIFQNTKQDNTSEVLTSSLFAQFKFSNPTGSTLPKDIESADSIRQNAPTNFKSQYRLVTQQDFENFVRINFDNFISDVKVFTNWDYTSKYLKYFNDLKVNASTFQQIALNQAFYADACNFNNIYVCALPKISQGSSLKYLLPAQKELIKTQMEPIKMLTSEISFLDPIFKAVSFGFDRANFNTQNLSEQIDLFSLEIVKDPNITRTEQSIIADVVGIIQNYFNPNNQKLGQTLDYNFLLGQILDVSGVQALRTITNDEEQKVEGLSLLMWNPTYPDLDMKAVTSNVKLNPFDFAYLYEFNLLSNKIVVV